MCLSKLCKSATLSTLLFLVAAAGNAQPVDQAYHSRLDQAYRRATASNDVLCESFTYHWLLNDACVHFDAAQLRGPQSITPPFFDSETSRITIVAHLLNLSRYYYDNSNNNIEIWVPHVRISGWSNVNVDTFGVHYNAYATGFQIDGAELLQIAQLHPNAESWWAPEYLRAADEREASPLPTPTLEDKLDKLFEIIRKQQEELAKINKRLEDLEKASHRNH